MTFNNSSASLPGQLSASFEFFPPKAPLADTDFWKAVETLTPYRPSFVSVTYGAGGSTQERTLETTRKLAADNSLPVAGHLTCVGASRKDVLKVAERYLEAGIRHIVALRGDSATPGATFTPHPDGFASAAELVAALHSVGSFEISVAAYPEVHPDAANADADLDNLKRKIDAGAHRALTQFFFWPEAFLRFRDKAVAAGITVPIVPGILPITNFAQTQKFARACGTHIPAWIERVFSQLDQNPHLRPLIATSIASQLCSQLHAGGVRHFHFYTLNRAEVTQAICHLLGMRAASVLKEAA